MESKFNSSSSDSSYYLLSKDQILKDLETTENGLSDEEASRRLTTVGYNELTVKKKISPLSIFLEQFKNTLTLILIGSTLLILFIYYFGEREQSDLIEAGLIFSIVIMIAVLGFLQEYKAEKAIESLKKLLAFKAKVKRGQEEKEIEVRQIVPGDIVILEEGAKIPADIRLLEVFSAYTNESSLTGESTPVSKSSDSLSGKLQIADQKNMVFSGTIFASGRAIGIVVATGDRTEIGKIADMVSQTEDEESPIQKRLDQIGRMLGFIILGVCVIVFIFIMFVASDFAAQPLLQRIIHSFIASVALAVAAIPEGLPAVVTITLALGTQRMLRQNALVRKLNSIETLGSTDVICSDKTGTLTKGEMTVRKLFVNGKIIDVSGTGYEIDGEFSHGTKKMESGLIELLLQTGLNCNNAKFTDAKNFSGDPTEVALLVSARKAKLNALYTRITEIPFSSDRKMMTVVVKDKDGYIVFTKGAPEKVLEYSSQVKLDKKEQEITPLHKKEILSQTHVMSGDALRVLGFAYKRLSEKEYNAVTKDDKKIEKDLIFLGLQGMIDPPRIEVKPLITQCQNSGIRVIMITGDHIDTAKAVAKEIGITGDGLSGDELDTLSDQELKEVVNRIGIYARVNPSFKMRIVEALQKQGHIVAMTGDGVNDAPALKKADIGIAMGITGTDVAKEASDMVLLDDKFSTIIKAVEEGRGIFQNIRKFVAYLLSCNIGEVLVVFFAIMLFKEVPLTATMLLWINVITDGLPAVALGLDASEKNIMSHKPTLFQSKIITKRLWVDMCLFGILLTLGVLGIYYMNLHGGEGILEAKGAAFTALVIFELIFIYIIRSKFNTPFFSNRYLQFAVAGSILLQLAIIYIPFLAFLFEVKHIDLYDWIYIFLTSILLWLVFKTIEGYLDKIGFLQKQ